MRYGPELTRSTLLSTMTFLEKKWPSSFIPQYLSAIPPPYRSKPIPFVTGLLLNRKTSSSFNRSVAAIEVIIIDRMRRKERFSIDDPLVLSFPRFIINSPIHVAVNNTKTISKKFISPPLCIVFMSSIPNFITLV